MTDNLTPTLLPSGNSAMVLQLGETVDAAINARIINLAAALETAIEAGALKGVDEIIPTYRSLLVRYDPEAVRGAELVASFSPSRQARLKTAPRAVAGVSPVSMAGRLVRILTNCLK